MEWSGKAYLYSHFISFNYIFCVSLASWDTSTGAWWWRASCLQTEETIPAWWIINMAPSLTATSSMSWVRHECVDCKCVSLFLLELLNWICEADQRLFLKPDLADYIDGRNSNSYLSALVEKASSLQIKASSLREGITGGWAEGDRGAWHRLLQAGCGRSGVHTSFLPDLLQGIEDYCGLFVHLFTVCPPRGQFPSPINGGRGLTRQLTRSESESKRRSKTARRTADKEPC